MAGGTAAHFGQWPRSDSAPQTAGYWPTRSSGSHPSDRFKLCGTRDVVMICQLGSATDAIEAVAEGTIYRGFCRIGSVNSSHVRFR